jgi:hypothetical protein
LLSTGFTPFFKYAAIAQRSSSGMWRHEVHGIGGARYCGLAGKFPFPGVVPVISTSGVLLGRSPYRRALKI